MSLIVLLGLLLLWRARLVLCQRVIIGLRVLI
jgi:hypothetical protein